MSHSQLDKDQRKVLKMALTSVAVVPLSSLLLNSLATPHLRCEDRNLHWHRPVNCCARMG